MSETATGHKAALAGESGAHSILFVRDFDASVKFYTETPGIPLQYKEHNWAGLLH